jgi:hypothetical protein
MGSTAGRSAELDEVRKMLFPRLSPADGWAKIEWAMRRAADPEKQAAIEVAAERVQLRDGS